MASAPPEAGRAADEAGHAENETPGESRGNRDDAAMAGADVVILGVFMADTTYITCRMPRTGETLAGEGFRLGPGGKGSNQAVACARAGARTAFITRIGRDPFGEMALDTWRACGIVPAITRHEDSYTGAACILVDAQSGDNAIIISPGAGATITPADLDRQAERIARARIFGAQLEQPAPAARRGLEIARQHGLCTILDPAPATDMDESLLKLCDFVTPNETEAEALTGIHISSVDDARKAGEMLCRKGAGTAIITLGGDGLVIFGARICAHIPAFYAGDVVETTGAGDAFNGAFAAALARGMDAESAARFGCAAASLSVTVAGTASSMPSRAAIEALLGRL